jgi:hypothetical protein
MSFKTTEKGKSENGELKVQNTKTTKKSIKDLITSTNEIKSDFDNCWDKISYNNNLVEISDNDNHLQRETISVQLTEALGLINLLQTSVKLMIEKDLKSKKYSRSNLGNKGNSRRSVLQQSPNVVTFESIYDVKSTNSEEVSSSEVQKNTFESSTFSSDSQRQYLPMEENALRAQKRHSLIETSQPANSVEHNPLHKQSSHTIADCVTPQSRRSSFKATPPASGDKISTSAGDESSSANKIEGVSSPSEIAPEMKTTEKETTKVVAASVASPPVLSARQRYLMSASSSKAVKASPQATNKPAGKMADKGMQGAIRTPDAVSKHLVPKSRTPPVAQTAFGHSVQPAADAGVKKSMSAGAKWEARQKEQAVKKIEAPVFFH